ncbi:MAG: helix-turn-helix domain-containing protein [Pseudonocardiaceae bacterium]
MAIKGIDSGIFDHPDMIRALALRDIGRVYRLLVNHGVSQRYLAELVGQSQSEVSEILGGRQVQSYDVLERIARGLGVSRGAMGLSYGEEREGPEPLYDEVTEDMRRRALLAAGSLALFGSPILGELLELPHAPDKPTPLPSSLSQMDVDAITRVTRALEAEAQYYGGGGGVITPVAQRSERLLQIPASDAVKTGMGTAIADLHNVAGWAAYDSHAHDTANYHFSRAMTLGNKGDGYEYARAMYLAGVSTAELGVFNDGLKFLQLGQMRLNTAPKTKRNQALLSWLTADSACMLAHLDQRDEARKALKSALETWRAPDADDQAEMDWLVGLIDFQLGRPDTAQRSVAASLRHWSSSADRRAGVLGEITMASLYVQAGDSQGPDRAHQAITRVRELRSVRARERLGPLVQTLDMRPERQYRELASHARRVAPV